MVARNRIELPQNLELLCGYFNALDSAITLSRMNRLKSNFAFISPQVQKLTDRRFPYGHLADRGFSYGHLAQMKHILPEAIGIKQVQIHDEGTSCMKPDLLITINPVAIEFEAKSGSESKNMNLRELFRTRIEEFYKAHPQGEEIPEADLPAPFSHSRQTLDSNANKASSSSPRVLATYTLKSRQQTFSTEGAADGDDKEPQPSNHLIMRNPDEDRQPAVRASHFSPSFKNHFSGRSPSDEIAIKRAKTCQQ